MYFPYLRGKLNELVLLDECRSLIGSNGRIIPIVEPVKINTLGNLTRKVSSYVETNIPIILIVNPTVGELASNPETIFQNVIPQLNSIGESHILGYKITDQTTQNGLEQFITFAGENQFCFIHEHEYTNYPSLQGYDNLTYQLFLDNRVGTTYQNLFNDGNNIIIADGFHFQDRNADFPNDENFLDKNLTYSRRGFIGFGDYLIVGNRYRDNGGPAYAVVIHITYRKQSGEIGIRHFISERTTGSVDTPGKFLEALERLISDLDGTNTQLMDTAALRGFRQLYDDQYYPGLGFVKKLSMEHHVELMSRII